MCPNIPPMLEAHYGIPMAGAVLNALNFRLDAASIAFILEHGEAKVLLTDTELAPVIKAALAQVQRRHGDRHRRSGGRRASGWAMDYEELLASGDPAFAWEPPADEWDAISLCYTSGTTGNPKGVVYHHRGAFLNAMGNALTFGLGSRSVYLWTLPMFHCNGWTFTWAVTAVGGTHVCLRKVDPAVIFPLIEQAGVTHLCGAPIVLNMLVHAPAEVKRTLRPHDRGRDRRRRPAQRRDRGHGADGLPRHAPLRPDRELRPRHGLRRAGRLARAAHGRARRPDGAPGRALPDPGRGDGGRPRDHGAGAGRRHDAGRGHAARQHDHEGLPEEPDRHRPRRSAATGTTPATSPCSTPTATLEVKDRAKDIIISGGENISSLEVEEALYRHPAVLEAAVVAMPDERFGERPCAFVTLKPDAAADEAGIVAWCREHLAHYKAPARVVFGPLPKTSTGKIQKFELRERAKQG